MVLRKERRCHQLFSISEDAALWQEANRYYSVKLHQRILERDKNNQLKSSTVGEGYRQGTVLE